MHGATRLRCRSPICCSPTIPAGAERRGSRSTATEPTCCRRPARACWISPTERPEHLLPPLTRERTKKEAWLAEKAVRLDIHLTDKISPAPSRERAVAARRRTSATAGRSAAELPLPPARDAHRAA